MKIVSAFVMVGLMMSNLASAASLSLGQKLPLDGFDVTLNKVVQPGPDSLGGNGFTEYNLTIANNSSDKELVVSNVVIMVHGKAKPMVKDFDKIVSQGNTTEKNVATNAGAAAAGYVGGMFGVLGSMASMVGVNVAANKVYVDDPKKWHEALEQNSLPMSEPGISVFPGEKSSGSVWVNQSGTETADQIRFYVKQGGKSRLVKVELQGMPDVQASK